MRGVLLAAVVLSSSLVLAEEVADGGVPLVDASAAAGAPQAAPVAAVTPPPPPPALGFDLSQTPWGPARKTSGELFRSAAHSVTEGPLRWRWQDFSIAVGGQYFARTEIRDNADFNGGVEDHSIGADHRARLTVRASAKERVGILLEFQDVRGWGSEPNTVTVTPNTGLHQGYVDLKATSFLDVRIGRQELSYGEDRLIGNLDWAQSARAFDGIFLRVTASPAVTLDAFGMMLNPPTWLVPDAGGSRFHNSGSYFTGLYARARYGKAGLDVYGLGLLEDPGSAALGFRRDNNRFTVGARGFGAVGPIALVGEAAFQSGKVGQGSETQLAGAFAGKATYTLPVWGSPYITGEFSGATGDGDSTDGVDNTFHQLFPTAHVHLGFMDYVGWQNVIAGRGTVGFRPWGAHAWLDVHHFQAWDPRGAWYGANGAVFLAADSARTNANMGTELDFSVTVPVFAQVSVAGNVSVFLPGQMAGARGSSPSTWGFLYLRAQL